MRGPGLVGAGVALSFAACAAAPDYGTGSGGTTGAGAKGGEGGGGTSGGAGSYTPPPLTIQHPNPIISRGVQVFGMPASGASLVVNGSATGGGYHSDGAWNAGTPTEAAPAWVALRLTAGPTQILVSWDDGGTYDYEILGKEVQAQSATYGFPSTYHIDVSANSTNGADGDWVARASVTADKPNTVRTRAHVIDFTGMSWVKMVVTGTPANNSGGVKISEVDVHDISTTPVGQPADDTWFFMGDSITAFAYQRIGVQQPSFAEGIHAAAPHYFPAMINGGIGQELTGDGLGRLDEVLMLNPATKFFAITYGTNDEWGNHTDTTSFRSNLEMMIQKLTTAGRVPVLSHIPYSADGNHETLATFNAVIDDLTRTHQLQVGPDLTGWFKNHTDQLMSDNVHPNADGQKAMNALWTSAMQALYPTP